MVGVPVGQVRLTIEVGSGRFSEIAMIGNRPASASTLIGALPGLTQALSAQLQRAEQREQREHADA